MKNKSPKGTPVSIKPGKFILSLMIPFIVSCQTPQTSVNPPQCNKPSGIPNPSFAAYSPDGKKVAFLLGISGSNDLYISDPDSSNKTKITSEEFLQDFPILWSPKDDKIAYVKYGDIYIIGSNGKNRAKITYDANISFTGFSSVGNAVMEKVSWSPDGTKIAYINGKQELFTINTDGSNPVKLSDKFTPQENLISYSDLVNPIWSPDSKKLAFLSHSEGKNSLFTINADGTDLKQLTDKVNYSSKLNWSPNGQKIAFVSGEYDNGKINLIDIDGTNTTQLTNNSSNDEYPVFSPDGKKIAFLSSKNNNISMNNIYIMDTDGSNQKKLTNSSGYKFSIKWSNDSEKILFSSNRNNKINYVNEIFEIAINNPEVKRISDISVYNESPVWSSDSSKIAFVSGRDGNDEIYSMDTSGSNQVRLTNNNGNDESPVWSPDSSKIAFISDKEGIDNIYIMDKNGANESIITDNTNTSSNPAWSPDGTKIAYISDIINRTNNTYGSYSEIHIRDLKDNKDIKLNEEKTIYIEKLKWSPDGTKIAFSGSETGLSARYLYIADPVSKKMTKLNEMAFQAEISWSSDSKTLAFVNSSDIFTINIDGSGLKKITSSEKDNNGIMIKSNSSPLWSPKGDKILFLTREVYPGITLLSVSNQDGTESKTLEKEICSNSFMPHWSPDGTTLTFVSDRTGNNEIFSISKDGSGLKQLTGNK